jgi:hypothetical protein
MFSKVTYRALVGETPEEYEQTPDQACLAIGANLVAGYRIEREETTAESGQTTTTVSVYGSNEETTEVLFGAFVFEGKI